MLKEIEKLMKSLNLPDDFSPERLLKQLKGYSGNVRIIPEKGIDLDGVFLNKIGLLSLFY